MVRRCVAAGPPRPWDLLRRPPRWPCRSSRLRLVRATTPPTPLASMVRFGVEGAGGEGGGRGRGLGCLVLATGGAYAAGSCVLLKHPLTRYSLLFLLPLLWFLCLVAWYRTCSGGKDPFSANVARRGAKVVGTRVLPAFPYSTGWFAFLGTRLSLRMLFCPDQSPPRLCVPRTLPLSLHLCVPTALPQASTPGAAPPLARPSPTAACQRSRHRRGSPPPPGWRTPPPPLPSQAAASRHLP